MQRIWRHIPQRVKLLVRPDWLLNALPNLLPNALLSVLATALLSGCASLSPPPPIVAPQQWTAPVYHAAITLSGRLSLRYQKEGREEGLQGGFLWAQDPQRVSIDLLSPLNQTMLNLQVEPGQARLTEAGKPTRVADDLDSLSTQTLGWILPVAGLRGWLQGFSLINGEAFILSAPGQEKSAPVQTADGWQLRYPEWQQDTPSGQWHPKRIELQRTTTAFGQMRIHIILDQWQTP